MHVVSWARADGVQHRQDRSRFSPAPHARVGDETGPVLRQARRPIAYEQAFAEPGHRFDVVFARPGGEMSDRVSVCASGVALFGALDVRR
jgi:hypothetical protein